VGADDAVIQLVTRCSSAEEFIERFARFTTETDVVVPALPHVSVGVEGPFVICLKDRSVVMKGRCEVTEIRPLAAAPGGAPRPPLMRLRLREMDAHSAGIHLRLMERHASSPRPPDMTAPAPATASSPASTADAMAAGTPPPMLSVSQAIPIDVRVAEVSAVTTVGERPSSPPDNETTAISPAPRTETRVPGASFTLPANPFGDLDAEDLASFVEAHLAPAARAETRLHVAGRIGRRAVPYAGCVAAGLLLGMALKPSSKAAPVVCAPIVVSPPEAAPPSTAAAAADATRDPAPRDCVARVTTKPAGATVLWGDIALGSSPIERAAIPCGAASVTLKRDHYADVTRTITAERGQRAVVAEKLHRPVSKLNRRRVGPKTAPRATPVAAAQPPRATSAAGGPASPVAAR
jgi:hypothetical protein